MHVITGWRPRLCAGKHILQNTSFCRGRVLSVSWFTSDNTTVNVSFSISPSSVPTFLLPLLPSLLPAISVREGPVEFCVASGRAPCVREDCIVPCGITQHPPAGGTACSRGETSLDIELFPTAWVFPVDDTGNATYWSVLLPVPLSFFKVFFFAFPLPWRDFCGKRKWKSWGSKSGLLDPWRTEVQQPVGHLVRGLGQVTDQNPSWGRGQGIGFGLCLTFFCYP